MPNVQTLGGGDYIKVLEDGDFQLIATFNAAYQEAGVRLDYYIVKNGNAVPNTTTQKTYVQKSQVYESSFTQLISLQENDLISLKYSIIPPAGNPAAGNLEIQSVRLQLSKLEGVGVAGVQGFQGITGTGVKGDQGFQGVIGEKGPKGDQGDQGQT